MRDAYYILSHIISQIKNNNEDQEQTMQCLSIDTSVTLIVCVLRINLQIMENTVSLKLEIISKGHV